ncbi:MAG: 4'-phosphopantetheinyl transferase family protein [Sediminibacterium sp.]
MPLYYQQDINENTRLAIWEIAEGAEFFLEKVSLRYPVLHLQKQLQHLAAGYLLPFLCPDFPYGELVYPEQGRPFIPGDTYFFSLTHSGNMAAAMVSECGAVGIDIEKITDRVHRVRHKFLSDEEWDWVQGRGEEVQRELLTLIWTVKEAVYKWRNIPGTVFSQDIIVSPFELMPTGTIEVLVVDQPVEVSYQRVEEYYISYVGGERPV